jgi:hypothetical protein
VVVEGYFLPYQKRPTKPTVQEGEEVEEKDEILRQGEQEKLKRRSETQAET